MKDLIGAKLDQMANLKDRKVLKEIMEEAFFNIIDYQEQVNDALEDRVFNIMEDKEKYYDIYATLVKREKVDLLDDFLFPILEEDKEEEVYDKEELIEKIKAGEEVVVTKVFLELEYEKIQSLIEEGEPLSGTIISDSEEYNISIKLKYNRDYLKAEEELYKTFLRSGIRWRTINNPYIRKIFDIVIVDSGEELDDITDFEEINFDLGSLEDKKHVGYVPVWNIKRVEQKSDGFPVPAEDKINYDHVVSLKDLGVENGYLVTSDNFNIIAIKKKEEDLIITCDDSNSTSWELLKIVQDNKPKNQTFEFELMSNSKQGLLMNRLTHQKFKPVRTFGDLNRIINSFKEIDNLVLEEVEILNEMIDEDSTYDFNFYIEDEIRVNNSKKVMLLKFKDIEDNYLKYDLLSFVISEVQMHFAEYICKGVFI
ncbi:hypothetical protein SAMN04488698_10484 [Candidatus Frackibacter sp. WG12]|uniref:hypothetical protein n=2 Tax=Candidatus Frackibacter TaxID=2017975 RepID=UPI00088C4E99|nr:MULTISPECIES: hypothetical protein [unclassified Candidatus Frackibacter]SDC16519.1 hypothetical protein SAMN04515661_10358 [Candidatus Frackibacter sp. WG11]SEM45211.1 hypothetical protein SAMN04488698_10484 [Candidatus Frackibacter sp. WG12]